MRACMLDVLAGNNSPQIAPPTGAPAITVPMGFLFNTCRSPLPAGIQFLARPWEEGTLLKLAYAYEQATQHRACANLPAHCLPSDEWARRGCLCHQLCPTPLGHLQLWRLLCIILGENDGYEQHQQLLRCWHAQAASHLPGVHMRRQQQQPGRARCVPVPLSAVAEQPMRRYSCRYCRSGHIDRGVLAQDWVIYVSAVGWPAGPLW